jgi:hypothetical protein
MMIVGIRDSSTIIPAPVTVVKAAIPDFHDLSATEITEITENSEA